MYVCRAFFHFFLHNSAEARSGSVLQPAQNKGLDEAALRKAIGMLGGTGLQVQRLHVCVYI